MYSVFLSCNVHAPRATAKGYEELLREAIAREFGVRCTEAELDGSDHTPGRGFDVKLWFASKPGEDYVPGLGAKIAEGMAQDARVLGRGRTESVSVCFWDIGRVQKLDEYRF